MLVKITCEVDIKITNYTKWCICCKYINIYAHINCFHVYFPVCLIPEVYTKWVMTNTLQLWHLFKDPVWRARFGQMTVIKRTCTVLLKSLVFKKREKKKSCKMLQNVYSTNNSAYLSVKQCQKKLYIYEWYGSCMDHLLFRDEQKLNQ